MPTYLQTKKGNTTQNPKVPHNDLANICKSSVVPSSETGCFLKACHSTREDIYLLQIQSDLFDLFFVWWLTLIELVQSHVPSWRDYTFSGSHIWLPYSFLANHLLHVKFIWRDLQGEKVRNTSVQMYISIYKNLALRSQTPPFSKADGWLHK